jgi:hypothetical protein
MQGFENRLHFSREMLKSVANQIRGWISMLCILAGFARLPGGFAARGGSDRNRCEDAKAFRMPQARIIKPESEALLRPEHAAH